MRVNRRKRMQISSAVIAIIIATTLLDTDSVNKRRWWVRPWLNRRNRGSLHLIKQEFKADRDQFKADRDQFKQYLRMDEGTFNKLLKLVEKRITKLDTSFREAISAQDKLIITLRFLATGETYRSLMYTFRVSKSTISLFVPLSKWNTPNVVGAMDGKHVVLRAPRSAGSTFYNYKGDHSSVLLAVVDANYQFIYIDVGTNGRISDGGVYRQSSLSTAVSTNTLKFPEDRCLPGRTMPIPFVLVADAAFPLQSRIIKPYPFRNMTRQQRIFNYRLSRARRVVENAFGILANRFRVFLTTINLSPNKVQDITLACCVLHNFLRKECKNFINDGEEVEEKFTFLYGLSYQGGNGSSNYAADVREEFKDFF
ncbi:hypothetical protein RI129_003171 [Pyrocoelia pectoralis]|uniref:DDE Tnp4 domain-containing protein n=1 Tax=Pyrocoelia pectoralis TaxID=417401 RepID=A0AAN7VNV1_9COLE